MKMIVGLGNPGKEYENTRHNVGFMFINYFPGNNLWTKKFNAMYSKQTINGEKVLFVKPLTYMNLSGDSVVEFVKYFKIKIDDILIIQDDLDLPVGSIKLKYKSSAGGHNGMKSIINRLGTNAIPRLKIGIANNKLIDTKDYVLGKFSKDEIDIINSKMDTVSKIILSFIENDINYCMSYYNGKQV